MISENNLAGRVDEENRHVELIEDGGKVDVAYAALNSSCRLMVHGSPAADAAALHLGNCHVAQNHHRMEAGPGGIGRQVDEFVRALKDLVPWGRTGSVRQNGTNTAAPLTASCLRAINASLAWRSG